MNNKVGIIGAGHVGSHCAYALLMQGICNKIIFNDIIKQKAVSQALDCMDTLPFIPHRAEITAGELEDIAQCDILLLLWEEYRTKTVWQNFILHTIL